MPISTEFHSELLPTFGRNLIRRIPFWRSSLRRLVSTFLPNINTVTICPGLTLRLDLSKSNQRSIFWFYEETEPALQWAIRNLLPKNGTFVDCGANIGLMGLLALHHKQAKVLFIEPIPRLAEQIRTAISGNGFSSSATVFECAASDRDGEGVIFQHLIGDGRHSLEKRKDSGEALPIKLRRLPSILEEAGVKTIDFLKIDTEGHDLNVIIGLGDFLSPENVKAIHSEMGEGGTAIAAILAEKGYTPFQAINLPYSKICKISKHPDNLLGFFKEATPYNPAPHNWLWVGKHSLQEEALRSTRTSGILVENQ